MLIRLIKVFACVSHNNSLHFDRCCLPMKLGSGDRLAVTPNSSPEHMMLCCHYLNVRLSILLTRNFGHFPGTFFQALRQKLTLAFDRPRHFEKPEMYLWEKIHLVDHPAMFAKQIGLRRRRWFQMYKVDQHGR